MESFITKTKQFMLLTMDAHGSVATVSTFQKTGKLTPDEFVAAGDFLVENFKTWSWGAGLPEKRRPHLPADKQFLQEFNVPCIPIASGSTGGMDEEMTDGDGEDAWVNTGKSDDAEPVTELHHEVAAMQITTASGGGIPLSEPSVPADDDDDEDVPDIDEFNYDAAGVADVDPAALLPAAAMAAGSDEAVVATRTYDITITYDVHYATPRVWLFGYDSKHSPLKAGEWRQDFSPEHVDKTVTHEQHPHLGFSCPSIHPCKHAEAMLKMISLVVGANGGQLNVRYYLLIFFKFIQAIIPNIEYDYTGQFHISGSQ